MMPADQFRAYYEWAATRPDLFGIVRVPVQNIPNACAVGHLMYEAGSATINRASILADGGTEALNQETFHDQFFGVALDRYRGGGSLADGEFVRIATRGRFPMRCQPSTFGPGANNGGSLVGASENAAGNQLLDDTVEGVATANLAIGVFAGDFEMAALSTRNMIWVEIFSNELDGGPQASA